jgi:hypothetical protein
MVGWLPDGHDHSLPNSRVHHCGGQYFGDERINQEAVTLRSDSAVEAQSGLDVSLTRHFGLDRIERVFILAAVARHQRSHSKGLNCCQSS